jgi:hypothetical protein
LPPSDGTDSPGVERKGSFARIDLAESQLKRVFDYWRKLERDHYFNAASWGFVFFVVFLAALGAGGFLLYGSPKFLDVDGSLPNENLAIAKAVTHVFLFGTIVVFFIWGLRQVLRLWAFHEDLYRDARERTAMLHAFAALKGAEWLTPEDVNVVVRALFRATRLSAVTGTEAPATPFETIAKHIGEAGKAEKKSSRVQ